ncbi:hypothetical protein F4814DRAFT_128367 [Daldinia grandis]|nr:hypothetical protein F4814DRAFT_128367 [Daldinia grandis]
MLERIRRFKGRRSNKSLVTTRETSEKELKNSSFFKRLLRNRKKGGSGRSSTSFEQPPNFGSQILGQTTIPNSNGIGWKTSIPSLECDRSDIVQPRSSPVAIASPYHDFGLPETTVSGNVSLKHPDDFVGRYDMSPDAQPPPWIQTRTGLVTGPSTGLSTLFQQSIQPRPYIEPYSSRLQNRPSSSGSTNPSPQTFLSITPSTSCSSMISEPITKPTNSLSDEGGRNSRLAHSLSHRIALSQVFMYQARMSDRSIGDRTYSGYS